MTSDLIDEDIEAAAKKLVEYMNIGLVPERNEVCYCGSGKKFKKCCEAKKVDPIFSSHPEFGITDDALMLLGTHGEKLSEQDADEFLGYAEIIDEEQPIDNHIVNSLEALAKKYKNPFVWDELAEAYQMIGNEKKSDEIRKVVEKTFPDYLFSKISRAYDAFEQNKDELFPEIFNHCQCLTQLYPDRDIFHFLELWMFHEAWFRYSAVIDDLLNAECHFKLLEVIGEEDDPDLASAQLLIDRLRLSRRLKIAMNRLGIA